MTEETKMILEQLQKMDAHMQRMDNRLQAVETKVDALDTKVETLDEKVEVLDTKVKTLDTKVTEIQLTLENEVDRKIKIIAEGHLDLVRKLSEALKVEDEKEMLLLRMNMAEADIRRLKETVFASA